MIDNFALLSRALSRAAPRPDPLRKRAALDMAMKEFLALQEEANQARQSSEGTLGRLKGALKFMFATSTRSILSATTAVAAVILVVALPILRVSPLQQTSSSQPPATAVAPLADSAGKIGSLATPLADPSVSAGYFGSSEEQLYLFRETNVSRIVASPFSASASYPSERVYSNAASNTLKAVAQEPVSTFSVDVDTASWSYIRSSLQYGMLPSPDAVRIEEMLNYFPYNYAPPEEGRPISTSVGVMDSPWRPGAKLVHIGLNAARPAIRSPVDLVFLIDTSGSMDSSDKLPLLKQSLRMLADQLDEKDTIAIVAYADTASLILDSTPSDERAVIFSGIDNLHANGSTSGQAGLQLAYDIAEDVAADDRITRVILATDGDFNIGISEPEDLERFIADKRDKGIYLSVLGFGRSGFNDETMQALAQAGNGFAAYIDTMTEAQKVLSDQLEGALVPVANDVKVQVEWNPAAVSEYRLIGYETRTLNRADFNNDQKDAGEIGAGQQVTALFEITPRGSEAQLIDPLRYSPETLFGTGDEFGYLRLRYRVPGALESELIEAPILVSQSPLTDTPFAAAIAGFGQVLRGSDLTGNWSIADSVALADKDLGEDRFGYRRDALSLMRLATGISR